MKTKTRLFLCLATLLILISLTSCSGLLASKNTASGKGRITIELGGARAATGPEVEGYTFYLCPTIKNRSSYENYMMAMMATTAGTLNISNLPENTILYTGNNPSRSYEVETGYWFVFVIADVTDAAEFFGFTTTLVSENQTSDITLNMTQDIDFSEGFNPEFENTLYFIAAKDKYIDVDDVSTPLLISPDMSILPDIDFNLDNLEQDQRQEALINLILGSMFAGDGSCYKLSNIQQRNSKLYADVIKVSYIDASDSKFLSNVQIKYVTEYGIQLEAGATDYFLFTSAGMEGYMEWFAPAILCEYAIKNLKTTLGELYTEQMAEMLKEEYEAGLDPIYAGIIIKEPSSVTAINSATAAPRGGGRNQMIIQ